MDRDVGNVDKVACRSCQRTVLETMRRLSSREMSPLISYTTRGKYKIAKTTIRKNGWFRERKKSPFRQFVASPGPTGSSLRQTQFHVFLLFVRTRNTNQQLIRTRLKEEGGEGRRRQNERGGDKIVMMEYTKCIITLTGA